MQAALKDTEEDLKDKQEVSLATAKKASTDAGIVHYQNWIAKTAPKALFGSKKKCFCFTPVWLWRQFAPTGSLKKKKNLIGPLECDKQGYPIMNEGKLLKLGIWLRPTLLFSEVVCILHPAYFILKSL